MKNTTLMLTTSTGNYHMYTNTNHRTEISNANGTPVATGFKCMIWLLRNKLHSVELWSGNTFEGVVIF